MVHVEAVGMTTRMAAISGCEVFWGHYGRLGGVNRRSAVAEWCSVVEFCRRNARVLTGGAFQVQGCAGVDQKLQGGGVLLLVELCRRAAGWSISAANGVLPTGCNFGGPYMFVQRAML